MNKSVHSGLLILEISEIVMHEFWYNYLEPKYGEKSKLCYMIYSFIVYIKIRDIYVDIAEDVGTISDT